MQPACAIKKGIQTYLDMFLCSFVIYYRRSLQHINAMTKSLHKKPNVEQQEHNLKPQ